MESRWLTDVVTDCESSFNPNTQVAKKNNTVIQDCVRGNGIWRIRHNLELQSKYNIDIEPNIVKVMKTSQAVLCPPLLVPGCKEHGHSVSNTIDFFGIRSPLAYDNLGVTCRKSYGWAINRHVTPTHRTHFLVFPPHSNGPTFQRMCSLARC
ncbi:hypothetical protein TNCV_170811 [Trichonephila clavipes]|nr:hypothetical protein TNCV_170811 [Trichonephila clavipes]